MKSLQCIFYDTLDAWIQTCNCFIYPLFGSIGLLVQLCKNIVNTTFIVVPTFDQLQVELCLPRLNAMPVVSFPIKKYLKFFCDDKMKIVTHSLYHTSRPSLLLPWTSFGLHYLIHVLLNLIISSIHIESISNGIFLS